MKRLLLPVLLITLLAAACQPAALPPTAAPPTSAPATAVPATNTPVPTVGPTTAPTSMPATATSAPATDTAVPTSAPTSQPAATGTHIPTDLTPLRVVVRAADDTVQVVDTGMAAKQASQVPGLLPMGGSVGDAAYVLDFKDQPKAQVVDASGTKTLDFVQKPNYGLAVWPGNGHDQPRLAWATSPTNDPSVSQLFIANVDGSEVTAVITESVNAGTAPHQLVAERWSADGQSLYFSREPWGIGGYIPFAGASSLYRYNLADKSVTELIPFTVGAGGKMICLDDLTPDASLVVGSCADPKTITVHSVSGGSPDKTITAPGTVTDFRLAGGARFSPDATRVAFALAKGDPSGEQGYVAISDSLSGQSTFLTTIDGAYYTVVAWLNDSTLLLQLSTLTCNPTCTSSLWTIGTNGANLTKLTDGTFLTLIGGQ